MTKPSFSDNGRNPRSLDYQGKQELLAEVGRSGTDYPIYKLSDRLRRLARDLESRSLFMESPFGFKNEDQLAAMNDCRGFIEELTVDEVVALIEYYRESKSRNMPINGNELVGPILFEQWGRADGGNAAAWIVSQMKASIEGSSQPVDLIDPFAMDPSLSDISRVFSGWASVDPTNALSTWERTHTHLGLEDRAVLNLSDLDNGVRQAIIEASRNQSK